MTVNIYYNTHIFVKKIPLLNQTHISQYILSFHQTISLAESSVPSSKEHSVTSNQNPKATTTLILTKDPNQGKNWAHNNHPFDDHKRIHTCILGAF